jgi:hypothetical protein
MVYFQKKSDLGKFRSISQKQMLVIFTAKWSISLPFGIFLGAFDHFGIFFPFWYVVPRKIWQP